MNGSSSGVCMSGWFVKIGQHLRKRDLGARRDDADLPLHHLPTDWFGRAVAQDQDRVGAATSPNSPRGVQG